MRQELLNYIKGLKLKTLKVSDEYPFSNSGQVMYLKNPKSIYVDNPQLEIGEFMPVFSGTIDNEVYTVNVYFANDAKLLPNDYASIVNQIRAAKDLIDIDPSFYIKTCSVTTEYENDLMVTTFAFQFTKLT